MPRAARIEWFDVRQLGRKQFAPNRPPQGSGLMDTWESFFRQKSRRRSRRRTRETAMKGGVLLLLFSSIAMAIYLSVAGLPR